MQVPSEVLLKSIKEKIGEFNKTEAISFSKIFEMHKQEDPDRKTIFSSLLPENPGVYVIFEKHSPIYVGSTGKNKRTIRSRIADLLYYHPTPKSGKPSDRTTHSLTNKLLVDKRTKRFRDKKEFYEFISKYWQVRVLATEDKIDATMLEYALMKYLRPRYNSEIINSDDSVT